MQVRFMLCAFILWGFIYSPLQGFVLLSGPDEAVLAVSPENPSVTFFWNGTAPELTDLEEFEGGILDNLSNERAMEQIILFAFEKWNEVPASYIHFNLEKSQGIGLDDSDGMHAIVVQEDQNVTTAAYALPVVTKKRIIDCDISIGTKASSAKLMAYTMIHEIGHCLGLGHAHSNYGAIMGYSRRPRNLKLGADDIAGLIYLYTDPRYSGPTKEFMACAQVKGVNQKGSGAALLIFMLFSPLFLIPFASFCLKQK